MAEVMLPPINEKEFQGQVVQLATLRRWRCYHAFDARKSGPGFPDLVFVRMNRLIFAELKSDIGKQTAEQRAWQFALQQTKAEVYLWRPADWLKIQEILA
jgi:hypothetical protein